MFEQQVVTHCAPTLAGIKMAGLFSYYYISKQKFAEELKLCSEKLKNTGVSIAVLRERKGAALVYVYRKSMLCATLQNEAVAAFLGAYYDLENCSSENCWCIVQTLRNRFRMSDDFPHEIGIFLGYPLEDVIGFIKNEGKNYKCIGCWKVYCNEQAARCLFCKYDKCRNVYQRLFQNGRSLRQLTVAA